MPDEPTRKDDPCETEPHSRRPAWSRDASSKMSKRIDLRALRNKSLQSL